MMKSAKIPPENGNSPRTREEIERECSIYLQFVPDESIIFLLDFLRGFINRNSGVV